MGDSLSGNRTSTVVDDVEAQQSPWLCKVQETLRVMKEEVPNEMGFHILKVADYSRQPPAQFKPLGCRFGLHNREDLDVTGSEALKLSFVVAFGLEDHSDWNQFCNVVVPDPKSMLECYGLHREVSNLSEKEVQQVLALDALSLAVSVDIGFGDQDSRLWTPECRKRNPPQLFYRTFNRWSNIIEKDLCKIENQIPFVLIKRAILHINSTLPNLEYDANETTVRGESYLEQWMRTAVSEGMSDFMEISDDFFETVNAHLRLSACDHILDAAYEAICGAQGVTRTSDWTQEDYIYVPSATRLKESGIKIVGVAGPLCTMFYDRNKKCLTLPKMNMYDETVAIVRNMARYEEYSSGNKCMFHDYVLLMLHLIETPEDYKFLTKCNVIQYGCVDKEFETWKSVNYGTTLVASSREHNEMKRNINSRCKLRRHRLWSEFRTLFLSRPWLTLSALAVILVTAATLIQTYATVIGSNGMKPEFKP